MPWFKFFWTGFTPVELEPLLEAADAVSAALNGVTFSQAFTAAVRRYADLDSKLTTENTLQVEVIPVEKFDVGLETRGSYQYLCRCDIVVRKLITGTAAGVKLPDVDPLVGFVQELDRWLAGRQLAGECVWQDSLVTPVIHKHLREWHQYTGIIRVQYYVTRPIDHPGLINV